MHSEDSNLKPEGEGGALEIWGRFLQAAKAHQVLEVLRRGQMKGLVRGEGPKSTTEKSRFLVHSSIRRARGMKKYHLYSQKIPISWVDISKLEGSRAMHAQSQKEESKERTTLHNLHKKPDLESWRAHPHHHGITAGSSTNPGNSKM